VWFQCGTSTDPLIANYTSLKVTITTGFTNAQVATALSNAINTLPIFTSTAASNVVTINATEYGPSKALVLASMPAGTTTTIVTQGALDVLLSTEVSPALAIDETARSFVEAINRNEGEQVYAYYLSGVNGIPGQMLIEGRTLLTPTFYLLGNNTDTGASFNPYISPTLTISTITPGLPAIITTSTPHNLINGDSVIISNSGTNTIPDIDGVYAITYISTTQFSIPVNVISVSGETAVAVNVADVAQASNNQIKPNRIYYSKYLQPESVPITNYLDIGDEDKAVVRIMPLRNSIFVLKQ
jgi:hypothetical protein